MLMHILLSVVMGLVVAGVLLRMFHVETLNMGSRTIQLNLEKREGEKITVEDVAKVVLFASILRIVVYLAGWFMCTCFGDMDSSAIWNAWGNADGLHYLNLAELGYDGYIEDGKHLFLVFFPLYPWLIRLLHVVIPSYESCAYIISNVSYIIGCIYLYRLVAEEFSKSIAWKTVVFLSVFPFAFFFGAIRTESLFFMVSVICVYYIRKHKFLRASIFGALAALTRLQGVLLAIVALAELLVFYKPWEMICKRQWGMLWKEVLRKAICVPLMAVGTGIYLLLNQVVAGNPFQFLIHQKEHWYQESQWFTKTIELLLDYLKNQPSESTTIRIFLPSLVLFIIGFALLIYAVRRIPATYTVWFGMFFTMNYMMTWPLSIGRYLICTCPMFITMAVASQRHPQLEKWILIVSSMFQGFFMLACLRGMSIY